jgi:hypothetical protein
MERENPNHGIDRFVEDKGGGKNEVSVVQQGFAGGRTEAWPDP